MLSVHLYVSNCFPQSIIIFERRSKARYARGKYSQTNEKCFPTKYYYVLKPIANTLEQTEQQ